LLSERNERGKNKVSCKTAKVGYHFRLKNEPIPLLPLRVIEADFVSIRKQGCQMVYFQTKNSNLDKKFGGP
jgi:hypothetical protein